MEEKYRELGKIVLILDFNRVYNRGLNDIIRSTVKRFSGNHLRNKVYIKSLSFDIWLQLRQKINENTLKNYLVF